MYNACWDSISTKIRLPVKFKIKTSQHRILCRCILRYMRTDTTKITGEFLRLFFAIAPERVVPSFKGQVRLIIFTCFVRFMKRDSSVSVTTWLLAGRPGNLCSVSEKGRDFSSARRSVRLWGPRSLLSDKYPGSFPRG